MVSEKYRHLLQLLGTGIGFCPLKRLMPLKQRWGQQILSYLSRERSKATKHPDFPHFWAREVENRTASKAKTETQTLEVQCFMVLQPNLKFFPLKVLKLLFLRLKIDGFIPSFPKCNISYSDLILTAPSF